MNKTGIEIERKFLVRELPYLDGFVKLEIKQGYCNQFRVRKQNDEYILTLKSDEKLVQSALVRKEIELPLSKDEFDYFWEDTKARILKTRYVIPVGNFEFYLDIFRGSLEGLILAEIEFTEPGQEIPLPYWLGEEVTDDQRYQNYHLAKQEHL